MRAGAGCLKTDANKPVILLKMTCFADKLDGWTSILPGEVILNILQKYVFRELLWTFLAVTVILLIVMIGVSLGELLNDIAGGRIPSGLLGTLILLKLPEVLATMREGMLTDPQAQMDSFWESCGASDEKPEGELDNGGLRAGLDWIAGWDAGPELQSLGAPVLALAAENDRIVRKEASEAIWGGGVADLQWHPTGGHMLQLSEPEWCVEHIKRFADDLKP